MSGANRYVGVNFIHDNVKMAIPPAYFLQRLYDFDHMLVMLPSRYVPFAYVLGRRKLHSAGLTDKALERTITQPDTLMCLRYGLVPVTLIYKTGEQWNIDPILAQLHARDTWAVGGGDKFATLLDEQDAKNEQQQRQAIRDDMYTRSGDAWRSYQARTGQRTKLNPIKPRRQRA